MSYLLQGLGDTDYAAMFASGLKIGEQLAPVAAKAGEMLIPLVGKGASAAGGLAQQGASAGQSAAGKVIPGSGTGAGTPTTQAGSASADMIPGVPNVALIAAVAVGAFVLLKKKK